jgi:hypothetical protein
MEEADFWVALEHRVCGELAGLADRRLRFLWCDGFAAEELDLDGERPCVRGRVWIYGHRRAPTRFTLYLGGAAGVSRRHIDWAALLPAEDVTGWLTPDLADGTLTIDPYAAVHDATLDPDREPEP